MTATALSPDDLATVLGILTVFVGIMLAFVCDISRLMRHENRLAELWADDDEELAA